MPENFKPAHETPDLLHVSEFTRTHQSHFSTSDFAEADFLRDLEQQLKKLWSDYMGCVDKEGFSEGSRVLREKYFSLYRYYRQNKDWKNIIKS